MSMLIRFLRVLSCLAALAGSLTLVAEAKGAGPFAEASGHRWQRFNRDPAYESMTRAKTDVMLVLHQRKWPKEVIDYFSAAVWEEPGRRVRVVNGDRLDFMRTGPSGLWLDVPVDFRESPAKNMEFAAPATEWSYEYQGRTYRVGIPDVCNNLYGIIDTPKRVQVPEDDCVTVRFRGPRGGHVRWGDAGMAPLPPSRCNAQRQGGAGAWSAWYGECDDCIPAIDYMRRMMGSEVFVNHRYYYAVTEEIQEIRFSRAVWETGIYLCLEAADGTRTDGVYVFPGSQPGYWARRMLVEIPDHLWQVEGGYYAQNHH